MKKYIHFLILLFISLIFIPKDTYAVSFYEDNYIPNVWMNKKNPDDGLIYYNQARFIRENGTNKFAYCIEPFVYLNSDGTYSSTTSPSNYTKSQIENMTLAAHFGYGYKNHTEDKWYALTQMYIWKIAKPNAKYYYSSEKNGKKVEMFENETNELKNLIENYKKDTQFNNQTYYSVNNQVFVKTDFNQALRNYKIKDTNAGKIIIHDIALQTNEPLTTGEYYVTLERNSTYHNKPTLFYQSSTNQDIITIGDPTPKTNTFNIKVINTEVNVRKIDSETLNTIPQGDGELNNSIFTLYDRYDAKIKDIKLNEDGTFQIKDLNFNTYYIKEKTPGTGYKLNEKKYSFTLTPENPIVNIDIANEIIKGTIKIKKEYGTTNNFKPEPNISFNIYNSKDEFIKTITTNTSGEVELTLPYGKYKLIQLTTTEGYQKVEPIEFEINEDNLELSYNLQNYKIDVPNTFSTTLFEKIINFIKDIICGKN